jgi:ketosteroid isomerase-like protein
MLTMTSNSDSAPADVLGLVRRAWDAWTSGDLDAAFALFHPDAELVPIFGGGRTLRGRAAAQAYLDDMAGEGRHVETLLRGIERRGACVVVSASVRQYERHGFRDASVYYVFFVRDGLIDGIVAVSGRDDALALADRCSPRSSSAF